MEDLKYCFESGMIYSVAKYMVPDWGAKLAPAWGCRTGPPGYIVWQAGTTTLCPSQLYPQSGTLNLTTGNSAKIFSAVFEKPDPEWFFFWSGSYQPKKGLVPDPQHCFEGKLDIFAFCSLSKIPLSWGSPERLMVCQDSCYNMVQCVAAGHEIVGVAHLRPPGPLAQEIGKSKTTLDPVRFF